MKVKQAAVLEPKAPVRKSLVDGLKRAGLKVSSADSADRLGDEQLVVIGPSMKGPQSVVRAIRRSHPHALVLSAQKKVGRATWADGVLPLPISPADLKVRLPELVALRQRPAARSGGEIQSRPGEGIVDPLTSFYTFAHFKEVLFVEVKRARRYGFPLSLGIVGFDPLPSKITGELRESLFGGLALAIRRSLRDTDYPVQYSPDRVLMLMPHTDLQGALVVSRRIVERVSRATLQFGNTIIHPTISAGVSTAPTGGEISFADMARQAQLSLEEAQRLGGNRIEFWDTAQNADAAGQVTPTAPSVAPEGPKKPNEG